MPETAKRLVSTSETDGYLEQLMQAAHAEARGSLAVKIGTSASGEAVWGAGRGGENASPVCQSPRIWLSDQ